MSAARRVPLSALERAVPFLLVIDRQRRVTHIGRLFRQVCPAISVGDLATDHLDFVGPEHDNLSSPDLSSLLNRSLTLQLVDRPLRFRAELLVDGRHILVLANPLFTSRRQLESMNLELDDLPPSHPLGEYLALLNSLRGSLRETRDLSERLASHQRELLASRQAAESANAAKTRFLATTSHELRTPMHGVLGLLDATLSDDRVPPDLQERLTLARSSAQGLLGLLDDLLDLAKVEAGELRFEQRGFSVPDLLDEVVAIVTPRARVPVRLNLAPEVPKHLLGDRHRIRQVLLNLAGNAARFTDAGHIALSVHSDGSVDSRVQLRIDVEDTGPGIAPAAQERVFDAFQQAADSPVSSRGGTGLGLAIARDLVAAMGGRIALTSAVGRGSTFTVHLGLEVSLEASLAPSVAASHHRLSGHVLVAEDNPVNQVVVRLVLDSIGISSTVVSNGRAAVDAVATQPFDAILMDVHMPELDGLQATARIKAERPGLPVVGLTASTLSHELDACRDAGMDIVLPKPFTRDQLARILATWMGRQAA